jgi:hypothetical protein
LHFEEFFVDLSLLIVTFTLLLSRKKYLIKFFKNEKN